VSVGGGAAGGGGVKQFDPTFGRRAFLKTLGVMTGAAVLPSNPLATIASAPPTMLETVSTEPVTPDTPFAWIELDGVKHAVMDASLAREMYSPGGWLPPHAAVWQLDFTTAGDNGHDLMQRGRRIPYRLSMPGVGVIATGKGCIAELSVSSSPLHGVTTKWCMIADSMEQPPR